MKTAIRTNQRTTLGLIAQYTSAERLVEAAKRARKANLGKMDAYAPFPVEGLDKAMGLKRSILPWAMFWGGVTGALTGYGMQAYSVLIGYPYNVGGRPLHSWPAFIPITFELTVLFAALVGFFGLWFKCGLPKPYHPVFNVEEFRRASQDGFFLLIETSDDDSNRQRVRSLLKETAPIEIREVRA